MVDWHSTRAQANSLRYKKPNSHTGCHVTQAGSVRYLRRRMPQMRAGTILLLILVALLNAGCAAVQPLNPSGPRRNQPPYPVVLTETSQRTESALANWAQLLSYQSISGKPGVPLRPITATIQSLPANLGGSLYLPKVGATATMNQEETRESLRRFLNEWQNLLGADPAQLSLVQESTNTDGTKTAIYEQKPFTYPLRGDFGKVEVRFAPDRRLISVSSNAIPDSQHIQSTLAAATPKLKSDEIPAKLIGRRVSYNDATGEHTITIDQNTKIIVEQLVVYPLITAASPALEFHLAWEISLANSPVKTIYLDAVKDEVIAALPSP